MWRMPTPCVVRKAASGATPWQVAPGSSGVLRTRHATTRASWELERAWFSTGDRRLESAAATSKTWGGARLPRVVQNKTSTEWYRRAKATKRREMDTRQSERPVVPQKLGHLTRGTQRREEGAGGTDPQE